MWKRFSISHWKVDRVLTQNVRIIAQNGRIIEQNGRRIKCVPLHMHDLGTILLEWWWGDCGIVLMAWSWHGPGHDLGWCACLVKATSAQGHAHGFASCRDMLTDSLVVGARLLGSPCPSMASFVSAIVCCDLPCACWTAHMFEACFCWTCLKVWLGILQACGYCGSCSFLPPSSLWCSVLHWCCCCSRQAQIMMVLCPSFGSGQASLLLPEDHDGCGASPDIMSEFLGIV